MAIFLGVLFLFQACAFAEPVTIAFSPRGEALQCILKELGRAKSRVDVAQFYIIHPDLIDALCALSGKGVAVRLISNVSMGEPAHQPIMDKLAANGVQVFLLELPNRGRCT